MSADDHETVPFDRRQAQAIVLLMRGATRDEVATAIGVTRGTVDAWCAHPDFARALAEACASAA